MEQLDISYQWADLRKICYQISQHTKLIDIGGGKTAHLLDFRPYQVTPGWQIGRHTHSFYEIHLFLQGEAFCTTDEFEQPLHPGSVMVLPPFVPHSWRAGNTNVMRMVFYFRLDADEPLHVPASWPVFPDLLSEVALLLKDVKTASTGWRDRARFRLGVIFSRIISVQQSEEVLISESSGVQTQITMAEQFMRDNLAIPLTVSDIAAHVGMSESGIAHLFARSVGQALMDRYFNLRMDRAAELLLDSDATLAEIGMQVGMSDPSYFCRRFHRHFSMTPMCYRNQLNAGEK